LLGPAKGLAVDIDPGRVVKTEFELGVAASPERLDWLLENVERLGHAGKKLDEIRRRAEATESRLRTLEGTTYAGLLDRV
jgi:hypothetical protein